MTEKDIRQYVISREILSLARQLNLHAAQSTSRTQLNTLLRQIRSLCKEMEKNT